MFKSLNFTNSKIYFYASLLIFIPAFVYINSKFFYQHFLDTIDFRFIWLSGHTWLQYDSPYTEKFHEYALQFFTVGNVPYLWFYPPNWYPISSILGLFSYSTANAIWQVLNFIMLFLSCFILTQTFQLNKKSFDYSSFFVIFAVTVFLQATAINIALGQTAILTCFGLSVLIYGIYKDSFNIITLGIIIMMFKPHIGIPFCIFLLFHPRFRLSVFIAAILVISISLPGFLIGGFENNISGIISNIASHKSLDVNLPQNTTGLSNLIYWFSRLDTPQYILLLLSFIFPIFLGIYVITFKKIHVSPNLYKEKYILAILYILTVTVLLIPLHTYDFIIIAPLIAFAIVRAQTSILALCGIGLIARSGNLEQILGIYDSTALYNGNNFSSIGSIILVIAISITFYKTYKSSQNNTPSM